MCILCQQKFQMRYAPSRRNFIKGAAAAGVSASALNLLNRPAFAKNGNNPPQDTGRNGRRYVIKGGSIMSMDSSVGDLPKGDILVEGKKILAIAPNINAGNADFIDARGRVVMPGFIDTHHHQFETALRSFLADGV